MNYTIKANTIRACVQTELRALRDHGVLFGLNDNYEKLQSEHRECTGMHRVRIGPVFMSNGT
jgi:hypothetical protein